MFQRAVRTGNLPKYLSSDPLYRFYQWQANLGVLRDTEIKMVPYVALSHLFVERLIGTVRREYLDRILFWTSSGLEASWLTFNITLMLIERMLDWKDACPNRVSTNLHQQ